MNSQKLKIGIVLNSDYISKNLIDLIEWCEKNQQLEIVSLINIQQKLSWVTHLKDFPIILLWSFILFIESIKFRQIKMKASRAVSFSSDLKRQMTINLDAKGLSLELKELAKLNLDLCIATEPNNFLSSLKDFTKKGVLTFCSDDISTPRDSPLGFDESLNKKDNTGFSILHLLPNSKEVFLIQEGSFPSHSYFSMNQENILLRRNFYLQELLIKIAKTKEVSAGVKVTSDLSPYQNIPSLRKQVIYLIHLLSLSISRLKSVVMNTRDSWHVALSNDSWDNLNMNNAFIIKNPKNHFLADPFVINEENKNYCFMEDYDFSSSKGHIVAYEITSNGVKKLGIALKEEFHLSFPFLFRYNSKIYMLPETSENNDIRIYESIEFPLKWKLSRVIKSNLFAVDSMVFEYQDKWWLFSNINPINGPDTCSELSIFYGDNPLTEEWTPHPNNPVIFSPSSARNGGLIIEKDSIFRVGQKQIYGTYGGGGFSVNEIIELNTSGYKEKEVLKIKADFYKNIKGAHHMHSNGVITAFDFLK